MSDINQLLSKYFAGEATPAEEKIVLGFKLENPEEYNIIKTLWEADKTTIHTFDTAKAWENIQPKSTKAKPRPIYRYLKIATAAAAIILLISVLAIQFSAQNNSQPFLTETTTELDSTKKVELPDGSIIYLNKNSSLSYPSTFQKDLRAVTLKGEAFFEIARDTERPFRIITNHSEVEVLGTSFNINTNKDQTKVDVATGKVKVQSAFNDESAILIPHQSALITKTALKAFPTKNENYQAWKTGNFIFQNEKIQNVIRDLNTFYPNQIVLSKPDIDCPVTYNFNNNSLNEILEIIQLTCKLKLKDKNGSYELY